jgi:hypothetical protein
MQVFSSLTLNIDPVAVYWKDNNDDKCQIFRDAQTAMAHYYSQNLWEYGGKIFAESGQAIAPPEKPTPAKS